MRWAKCKGSKGKFNIKTTVKSKLEPGTMLTLVLDDTERKVVTIGRRGKAKAKWKKVDVGDHEVCVDECPGLCKSTHCKP